MPFTPFHLGPALLIGMLLFPWVSIASILISSIIVDIEPACVLFMGIGGPLHGPLHSYLGATMMSFGTTLVIYPFRKPIVTILSWFRIDQDASLRLIFLTALLWTYSHIFLDSFLYSEMNPFLPLLGNPFYGLVDSGTVYLWCSVSFIMGLVLYVYRFLIVKRTD
jgi:hypothetical protein